VRNESSIENIGKKGSISTAQANVNIYTPTEGSSVLAREGDFIFAMVKGVKTLIGYDGNDSVVTLPGGSYRIAEYLFYYDTSVTRVVIPESAEIQFTATQVFTGCSNLEAIFIDAKSDPAGWSSNWSCKRKVVYGFTGETIKYNFVTNGAEHIEPISSVYSIALPTPSIDGYVFIGWYDNAEFEGEAFVGDYYSSSNNTRYAHFMDNDEYIEEYLRGYSMEYAYAVESGKTYAVNIQEKGTQNYYAITAESGDKWNFTTPSGMGYHKIWIYDSNGTLILTYTATGAYDPSHDINFNYTFTKDGTYYIGVGYKDSKRTGTFEVTITEQ
jgi:hypothetical protein